MEEQIARQGNVTTDWRAGTAMSPHNIHHLLDASTLMISYYTIDDQLYALTATHMNGDLATHALDCHLSDIATRWRSTRRVITRPSSRLTDMQARLAYFWDTLIAPLASRLQDKSCLLIMPHQKLFHIPFAALYDAGSGQYLVEQWTVQLAPSATILERCQRQRTGTQQPLLVGYPGCPDELGYLPGVKEEIQLLARLLPDADILLGKQATADQVLDAATGSSLVHIAGHTFFDSTNPLESGLPLDRGRWLRAADLYIRYGHLDGATIVLSGCSTGRGKLAGGDVLGLTSAFLYAGAVGIIAGLWHVDDAATVKLMDEFYHRLASGTNTANALRLAQLTMLRSEQYAHPYFWAPFGLNGDKRVLSGHTPVDCDLVAVHPIKRKHE